MKGFGAVPTNDGFAFRVWAPRQKRIALVMERPDGPTVHPMTAAPDGTHSATLPGLTAGGRYRYRLDDGRVLPDPASRCQPDGVHGPSALVDPRGFPWTDGAWGGIALEDVAFYELHVGTFSPEGTFAGAAARLPELAALGVTAVELMPVADFPGNRNWGYDGVALFAPARCYGTPDDLRRLVDAAHALGLAVFLDVVYNHFGPDGAYAAAFSPHFFTDRHRTPWGAAMNFDGEGSETARAFFLDNARHWITEYHFDGLRLDATHAIVDDGPRHFLAELTAHVRGAAHGRRVLVIAEDHRNLSWMLEPESKGGWGLDGVWADAFHHQCRRLLAGDSEGYYRDYSGRTEDLATTMRRGWFYIGQQSVHLGEPRGTDPAGIPVDRFVICVQNHDQIGNRALGTRLHHEIDAAPYRAVSALLLTAPETPLLFMGQEWAASTPFLFFTDHNPELGRLVTEGRREEFRHFAAFSDPAARDRIPDPQAESTFLASRLRWDERAAGRHASTLRLYRAVLELRRREPALRMAANFTVDAPDEGTIALRRDPFLIVVRLHGDGAVPLPSGSWTRLLTTEDEAFCDDPEPAEIGDGIVLFRRPGAVILKSMLR